MQEINQGAAKLSAAVLGRILGPAVEFALPIAGNLIGGMVQDAALMAGTIVYYRTCDTSCQPFYATKFLEAVNGSQYWLAEVQTGGPEAFGALGILFLQSALALGVFNLLKPERYIVLIASALIAAGVAISILEGDDPAWTYNKLLGAFFIANIFTTVIGTILSVKKSIDKANKKYHT